MNIRNMKITVDDGEPISLREFAHANEHEDSIGLIGLIEILEALEQDSVVTLNLGASGNYTIRLAQEV